MKRFVRNILPAVLAFAMLVPQCAVAQNLTMAAPKAEFDYHPLPMRNTSAASVAAELNWSKGGVGQTPAGFADSLVFRRAVSATARDTSVAFKVSTFAWPPSIGANGSGLALSDTTLHAPWISVRVRQDTLMYSWSGGTALDSVFFAVQWSPNGINWTSMNGTPTRAFETTNGGADENGLTPVLIGPYGEPTLGSDVATAYLGCVPNLAPVNSSYIVNQTACLCEGYVRFIFVFDGTGQFLPEIGYWSQQ